MQNPTRRAALLAFSVPVAGATNAMSLPAISMVAKDQNTPGSLKPDWRGLPQRGWRKSKLSSA